MQATAKSKLTTTSVKPRTLPTNTGIKKSAVKPEPTIKSNTKPTPLVKENVDPIQRRFTSQKFDPHKQANILSVKPKNKT